VTAIFDSMAPQVKMLWSTAVAAASQMPVPERNANNCSYPVIAAYHRARKAIEVSPHLADWIAGRAILEMARIVRNAHDVQLALFDPEPGNVVPLRRHGT
jgi:hypothetical protein